MSARAKLITIGILLVVLVALCAAILAVRVYRAYDSPAIGVVSTWPSRSGGFVRYQADADRIAYVLFSELDEKDVSIGTTSTHHRGAVDMSCNVTTTGGSGTTISLGRNPRLILVKRDGSVVEGSCPMTRSDLEDVVRLFRMNGEAVQGRADSAGIFLDYVRSRPDLEWPEFVTSIARDSD